MRSQPQSQTDRHPKNARSGLLQGRAQKLVSQMVSPENIHTSNIIQMHTAVCIQSIRNIYACVHKYNYAIYVCNTMKKRRYDFFGRRKEKNVSLDRGQEEKEWCDCILILLNKLNH